MANNLIQIKRSLNTANPGSLANGELAFTSNGDVLFIGANSALVPIAGKRVPGTLTANQALVANATSYLDVIKTANLYIGSFTVNAINAVSNSSTLGSASNSELVTSHAVKNYVDLVTAAAIKGTNTQIIYNNSGQYDGTAAFTFNNSTNTMYVANTIQVGGATVNSSVFTGSADYLGGVFNTAYVQNTDSRTLSGNINFSAANTYVANLNVVTINRSPVITLAGDASGSVTLNNLGSNTLTLTLSPSISVSNISSGNATFSNVSITGNTTIGDSTSDTVVITSGVSSNIVPYANVTHNLGTTDKRWNQVFAANGNFNYGTFNNDVTISGNLYITGQATSINVATVSVTDSLIQLASNNNSSDSIDIGIYGNYDVGGGANEYTGIFRDASDNGIYKLFSGLQVAPTTTVDTGGTGFTQGTLRAFLTTGGAFVANTSNVVITANSSVGVSIVANTLTLSTPLAGNSGGTGLNSISENSILVGNSTNGFNLLTLSTDGTVLQSNGTALVYNTLDGGTF